MKILSIQDPAFQKYGTLLTSYDFSDLTKEMKHTPVPSDDVIYLPSLTQLESLPVALELQNRAFGGLPIQIGCCNGRNHSLTAVEYHRSSELDIAVTDLILLLGRQQDIRPDWTYDTSNMEAFLLPAGSGIQLYATTLHYAPVSVEQAPFQCVIVLPQGTNTELSASADTTLEDRLLTAKNKWLIQLETGGIFL